MDRGTLMWSVTHWADTVHQSEERSHHPLLHLVLSSFSLWTQGVELVNEDDGRLSVHEEQESHKHPTTQIWDFSDLFIWKGAALKSKVCQYNSSSFLMCLTFKGLLIAHVTFLPPAAQRFTSVRLRWRSAWVWLLSRRKTCDRDANSRTLSSNGRVPPPGSKKADRFHSILAHDLWTVDHRHMCSDLIGYGSTYHGLAGAGGAVEEDSSWRRDACRKNNHVMVL